MASEMKGTYHIYVLVDTDPKEDIKVEEKLLKIREVKEVHFISGPYDLLAVIDITLMGKPVFSTVQEIAQKVIQQIRRIPGVRDTSSMIPFLSYTKKPHT